MYIGYFAQGIPKIDAEIAENSRFRMETRIKRPVGGGPPHT